MSFQQLPVRACVFRAKNYLRIRLLILSARYSQVCVCVQYTLETFTEVRSTAWEQEPYTGRLNYLHLSLYLSP